MNWLRYCIYITRSTEILLFKVKPLNFFLVSEILHSLNILCYEICRRHMATGYAWPSWKSLINMPVILIAYKFVTNRLTPSAQTTSPVCPIQFNSIPVPPYGLGTSYWRNRMKVEHQWPYGISFFQKCFGQVFIYRPMFSSDHSF